MFMIQAKYEQVFGDEPLLKLSDADYERGWDTLQDLGVPRDAWFVCLHARESGYLPNLHHNSFRDVDVDTYMEAAAAIVQRGGWVIRMGDSTMKPLTPMAQVIDYVHSGARSDSMDVFCFAQCKFFLGSASGALDVSYVFGVPLAIANYAPMGIGTPTRKDVWIPKQYWSIHSEQYLSFNQIFESPLSLASITEKFDAANITLVGNTPEDIKDLAVEMMDRLDSANHYTTEDDNLQKRFKTLMEANPGYATGGRVGREFLRRYQDLLK
jgi:putative glycosyltransferase (TIGR04372 family)